MKFLKIYRGLLGIILIILLTGCSLATPPLEFAPNGDVIKQALLVQLNRFEEKLSQELMASDPKLEVSQVKISKLEPLFIGKLPTYHFQGKYNLILHLPNQDIKQNQNDFDLYLQRQKEGKTWRLLRQESAPDREDISWFSYGLQSD